MTGTMSGTLPELRCGQPMGSATRMSESSLSESAHSPGAALPALTKALCGATTFAEGTRSSILKDRTSGAPLNGAVKLSSY